MSLKFGTDGIRGVAYTELTLDLARRLGVAAAQVLPNGDSHSVFIGRDTRESGPELQEALAEGFSSAGVSVIDLGVIPTPGVAFCSAERNLPAAVISASHNPFADNGIKFFLPGGKKLSDDIESKLEAVLADVVAPGQIEPEMVSVFPGAATYSQHLNDQAGKIDIPVVLDCANGASSAFAAGVFPSAVKILFDEPNGRNINDGCGSTYPQTLQSAVVEAGAACGFAFDGDADRVLAVDHTGALIDGDHILALLALDMKAQGTLKDDTLVITVMANLGLKLAMESAGIVVHETPVGDRYVLEAMEANGWSLGGEQSGHVILSEAATTGDGMLTAIKILDVMKRSGKSLQALASVVTKMPQILRNVRVANRDALADSTVIWQAVDEAQAELGHTGRVLLRTSGTEPLVRVMVEAPAQKTADAICDRLCKIVEGELAS